MANSNPFSSKSETDWDKCCLCQTTKKGEAPKSPNAGIQSHDGYVMIASNILQFKAINQLPFHIVIERLDDGDGIEATLRKKQAKYHQSCRLLLNNTKLKRAKKRAADTEAYSKLVSSKVRRSSIELEKCFLCDSELTKGEPRQAMTMGFNQRLNQCARNLNDGKLLAILSAGDAVEQELKYDKACLTALYNKERAHLSSTEEQERSNSRESQVFPLVFSELVAFIMDAKLSTTNPLVFHLNTLVTMFRQRLEQFGIETKSRSDVHSTRLKERLLSEIPDLEAHSSGKSITLAFKNDIGPALTQLSSYSEAVVLSKAATILRKTMLNHKCSFDGRFNDNCVENSTPPSLMHFVYMIEHGVDVKSRSQPGACKTDSELKGDHKLKVLKEDYHLFSKLFISCQSRECDLSGFFKHENQPFPAALSDNGNLHSCQKSQLSAILEAKAESSETVPDASVIIVDGSALVNAMKPRHSKTFEEYAALDIVPKVKQLENLYLRTDIVFDVYVQDSLKCETRSKRGQGSRRRVTNKGILPANWRSFLRDNDNKTDLFYFLADKIVEQCLQNIIIVTKGENVVSNQNGTYKELAPCNHEEADTRMFVHLKHSIDQGHVKATLKASDTDILVIAVSRFDALRDKGLEKLWIEFGQGQTLRWIPIHAIASSVREKVPGMGFFHAFTGCDNVSAFRGKAKKAAWQTWDVFPEATEVFRKLSRNPPTIENEDKEVLEKFVITMYDRSRSSDDIHEVRLDMFARKQRQYDAIPPTRVALHEHIKRAGPPTKQAAYGDSVQWKQQTLQIGAG